MARIISAAIQNVSAASVEDIISLDINLVVITRLIENWGNTMRVSKNNKATERVGKL